MATVEEMARRQRQRERRRRRKLPLRPPLLTRVRLALSTRRRKRLRARNKRLAGLYRKTRRWTRGLRRSTRAWTRLKPLHPRWWEVCFRGACDLHRASKRLWRRLQGTFRRICRTCSRRSRRWGRRANSAGRSSLDSKVWAPWWRERRWAKAAGPFPRRPRPSFPQLSPSINSSSSLGVLIVSRSWKHSPRVALSSAIGLVPASTVPARRRTIKLFSPFKTGFGSTRLALRKHRPPRPH
mmetsp:Transcript_2882/g.10484  ORF Transcript_2882/g.10484 Transcript_2882/m.10484 type:complete len:239 (-) Transcript_2882:656-1372(-)